MDKNLPGYWKSNPAQSPMQASVIIATYNRCQSLKDTLDSLLAQEVDGNLSYEIIVVDNNSKDKTEEVVKSYVPQFAGRLKYLFELKQSKSHALNKGINVATGEILAFIDDDVIVDKNWLFNTVKCFHDLNCDGVGGRILPLHPQTIPTWIRNNKFLYYGPFVCRDHGEGNKKYEQGIIASFIGANVAYKKELFNKYGVFRTDMGPGTGTIGEDTEFFRRLLKNKRKLYYFGKALAWHKVDKKRMTYKYIAKWTFRSAKSSIKEDYEKALKEKLICYRGIPRCFVRDAIKHSIFFLINIFNRKKALKSWVKIFWNIGLCCQYRNLNMSSKTT